MEMTIAIDQNMVIVKQLQWNRVFKRAMVESWRGLSLIEFWDMASAPHLRADQCVATHSMLDGSMAAAGGFCLYM